MNKAELISEVASRSGKTKTDVSDIVDATFDAINDALKKQEEVRIPNFGVFAVVETKARKARNPQTNEPVDVPAGRRARFRPGKALKEALEAVKPAKSAKKSRG